jgi:uncharacterized membrane protein HdeD (DUF308 family)
VSWSEQLPPPLGPAPVPTDYLDDAAAVEAGEARRWWLAVLLGALSVGLGVWMLSNLADSVFVLALIIGVSLITGGLVDAFVLGQRRPRWAAWIEGLLLVLAGIVVLTWPDITLWALTFAGGLALLLGGVVQLLIALAHRHRPTWTLDLGLGVLGVVLGTIVLAWPEATMVVVAVLFGIRAVVVGLIAIAAGWQLRHEARTAQAQVASAT